VFEGGAAVGKQKYKRRDGWILRFKVIVFVLQPRAWFLRSFGDRHLHRLTAPASGRARALGRSSLAKKKVCVRSRVLHFVSSLYFFNNTLLYSS
jgi:hypothetical protein